MDAIYSWLIEYATIESLIIGMRDENSSFFRDSYDQVVDHTYQFYNLHNIPYFSGIFINSV